MQDAYPNHLAGCDESPYCVFARAKAAASDLECRAQRPRMPPAPSLLRHPCIPRKRIAPLRDLRRRRLDLKGAPSRIVLSSAAIVASLACTGRLLVRGEDGKDAPTVQSLAEPLHRRAKPGCHACSVVAIDDLDNDGFREIAFSDSRFDSTSEESGVVVFGSLRLKQVLWAVAGSERGSHLGINLGVPCRGIANVAGEVVVVGEVVPIMNNVIKTGAQHESQRILYILEPWSARLTPVRESNYSNDYFGDSLKSIGDVNADGVGDVAVGAPGGGYVELLSGANWSVLRKIQGVGGFGKCMTALGDANGDGVTDFSVGAPDYKIESDPRYNLRSGRVGVYCGATGAHCFDIAVNENNSCGLQESLGTAIAVVDDTTGDGVNELAVGAMDCHVRLYSGSDGTLIWDSAGPRPIRGLADGFAESLATIGDTNNDGVCDLVAGSFERGWDNSSGSHYVCVLSGKDGSVVWANRGAQCKVSSFQDFNEDGVQDVLLLFPFDHAVAVLCGKSGVVIAAWNPLAELHVESIAIGRVPK